MSKNVKLRYNTFSWCIQSLPNSIYFILPAQKAFFVGITSLLPNPCAFLTGAINFRCFRQLRGVNFQEKRERETCHEMICSTNTHLPLSCTGVKIQKLFPDNVNSGKLTTVGLQLSVRVSRKARYPLFCACTRRNSRSRRHKVNTGP